MAKDKKMISVESSRGENKPVVRRSLSEKIDWIKNYIDKNSPCVDIMNRDFIDAYEQEFSPKVKYTMYGANKCKEVSQVLKAGYDRGIFNRKAVGITCGYSGYPKWVYCYENCAYVIGLGEGGEI